MTFDSFEVKSIENSFSGLSNRLGELNKSFANKLKPESGSFSSFSSESKESFSGWLGCEKTVNIELAMKNAPAELGRMVDGIELDNGMHTVGLNEIHGHKINLNYVKQNTRQQAGFAAEIIGTTKENLIAKAEGTGITTVKADDMPEVFGRNDQYVDKVRLDSNGNIIERIQCKFVGGNAEECLAKLRSSKYDKYFDSGKVDKIEIPKDYYDDVKKAIGPKKEALQQQLDHVKNMEGKEAAVENIAKKIDRLDKIDNMLEKSTVTTDEAVFAVKHPKAYTAEVFGADMIKNGNELGIKGGLDAAAITATISTVDNVSKVISGEQTATEAVKDIAKDTGTAGAIGYGTAFVSSAASQAMSYSSHQLIKSLGNTGVPAAAITFGIESFDSADAYARGLIDGKELAYDLGENASGIAGSMAGMALAGAAVGSVVPGAGTAVGAVVGVGASLVGGTVGCAVCTEAYKTAVDLGGKGAEQLAGKASELANKTIDLAKENVPEKVDALKASFTQFGESCGLKFDLA